MKRARYIFAAAFLLGSFVPSAQAWWLSVSAIWTKPDPVTEGNYDQLVSGSIVQVVAYNSTETGVHAPGETADQNFAPYGTGYQPDTTKPGSGHELLYSGEMTGSQEGGFRFAAWVDIPDGYDTVYLRVFSATEWEQGVMQEDVYWGISDTHAVAEDGAGIGFTWWRENIPLNQRDSFEVIPEPGTLALLWFGMAGLAGLSRRRKGARRLQTGETGAEER